MGKNRFAVLVSVIGGILVGLGLCFFAPAIRHFLPPFDAVDWVEDERVTSPEGKFDAVLIREGLENKNPPPNWYLYVVEKGQHGPFEGKFALLHATSLKGQNLRWQGPHLLLIQYDIAVIQHFKNLWDAVDPPADHTSGKSEYFVEIRLVPTTPAFSILTPDGDFR
jgi:hypothetical protein